MFIKVQKFGSKSPLLFYSLGGNDSVFLRNQSVLWIGKLDMIWCIFFSPGAEEVIRSLWSILDRSPTLLSLIFSPYFCDTGFACYIAYYGFEHEIFLSFCCLGHRCEVEYLDIHFNLRCDFLICKMMSRNPRSLSTLIILRLYQED